MFYLIGVIAIVLVGFLVHATLKKNKCSCGAPKDAEKSAFRTEESLEKYDKPIDSHQSHVDFDDAE